MNDHLTEDEILSAIPGLTRDLLDTFIMSSLIMPVQHQADHGMVYLFRQIDFARLHLLCDLTDDLGLHTEAVALVIALLDQLHDARRDLLEMTQAVECEPAEVRARIGIALVTRTE